MFQAAITFAHRHDEKHIPRHGRRLAEETDMGFADHAHIAAQAIHVRLLPATEDDVVGHAAGLEGGQGELAHFHRMVHQLVVIRR